MLLRPLLDSQRPPAGALAATGKAPEPELLFLDVLLGEETLLRLPAAQGSGVPADAFGQLLLGNSSVLVGGGVLSEGAQELPEAAGSGVFRVSCHELPEMARVPS